MLAKYIRRTITPFGLTKFGDNIHQDVLPTSPQLTKPQVIDTYSREQYRH